VSKKKCCIFLYLAIFFLAEVLPCYLVGLDYEFVTLEFPESLFHILPFRIICFSSESISFLVGFSHNNDN
jgi:hypothetical protein